MYLLTLLTLLPLLFSLTTSQPVEWNHLDGETICVPTSPGTCMLGWEIFGDGSTSSAWVYDSSCTRIFGTSDTQVSGYTAGTYWQGDGMGESSPLYHIDCRPGLKYDVIMTGFDNKGIADNYDRTYIFPEFMYAGRRYGGHNGCGCGFTGLDTGAFQGCYCGFQC